MQITFLIFPLGKEEVIAHLNEENLNLFTLLKNIEKNIFDVEQVLELTDKKNKKLKGMIYFNSRL